MLMIDDYIYLYLHYCWRRRLMGKRDSGGDYREIEDMGLFL